MEREWGHKEWEGLEDGEGRGGRGQGLGRGSKCAGNSNTEVSRD